MHKYRFVVDINKRYDSSNFYNIIGANATIYLARKNEPYFHVDSEVFTMDVTDMYDRYSSYSEEDVEEHVMHEFAKRLREVLL